MSARLRQGPARRGGPSGEDIVHRSLGPAALRLPVLRPGTTKHLHDYLLCIWCILSTRGNASYCTVKPGLPQQTCWLRRMHCLRPPLMKDDGVGY